MPWFDPVGSHVVPPGAEPAWAPSDTPDLKSRGWAPSSAPELRDRTGDSGTQDGDGGGGAVLWVGAIALGALGLWFATRKG